MDHPFPALEELKIRARLARNAAKHTDGAPRLRDALHDAARAAGFQHWEHARRVLGGEATAGEDLGAFWHAPATITLLNEWFADLGAAREALARSRGAFLQPYRRQFVVVQDEFIRALHLDPADPLWAETGRDLVASYGGPAWRALCAQRVRAPRTAFD